MCCSNNSKQMSAGGCQCSGAGPLGPAFWSKEKRVKIIDHTISCMDEQIKDLKAMRKELAGKKS